MVWCSSHHYYIILYALSIIYIIMPGCTDFGDNGVVLQSQYGRGRDGRGAHFTAPHRTHALHAPHTHTGCEPRRRLFRLKSTAANKHHRIAKRQAPACKRLVHCGHTWRAFLRWLGLCCLQWPRPRVPIWLALALRSPKSKNSAWGRHGHRYASNSTAKQ